MPLKLLHGFVRKQGLRIDLVGHKLIQPLLPLLTTVARFNADCFRELGYRVAQSARLIATPLLFGDAYIVHTTAFASLPASENAELMATLASKLKSLSHTSSPIAVTVSTL